MGKQTLTRRGWLALAAAPLLGRDTTPDASRDLFLRINDLRVRSGLQALTWSEELARAAKQESEDMARLGFFAHQNPERGDLVERLNQAGISWSRCGENIFRENGFDEPVAIAVVSWWYSEGHRHNILEPGWLLSGIGVATAANGDVFATQIFSVPRFTPTPQRRAR